MLVVPGKRSERTVTRRTAVYTLAGPPAPGSPGYHVLWNAAQLRRVVADVRPDAIELGSVYTAPWLLRLARRLCRAPVVGFLHMDVVGALERLTVRYPGWAARTARGAGAAYVRRAYSMCEALVVTSAAARTSALSAGLKEPHVVPIGLDLERFRPGRQDPSWRAEAGVPDDRPIGLYVGRLAGEKELEVLAAALPELHRRLGMTVVLLGDGRLRRNLEDLERKHPEWLRVLGFEADRDRLARAYASADLCIAPCAHETFGLAALEAAACGLPVVGAGGGAIGEPLQGAAWGQTFTPGNAGSLVEAAAEVLARDRETVSREARRTAEAYSWERTFGRLFEIYRGLIR